MKTNVSFDSAGLSLAGQLYVPDGGGPEPRAAIVVGHPGGGVKEQTAGLYAERLAREGLVTLAFDAAFQGESEGEPRGLEDPAHRVADLNAAVSFLATRPEADAERIGAFGVCAAGGYAVAATATDHRIKAVATVSAVDMNRQFRLGPDGKQDPAVWPGLLDAAAADAHGSFPLFPGSEQEARQGGAHLFEGWEYYCTPRAQHPRSAKTFTWSSVDRIASFDAFRQIGLIAPRPLLMIAGREAVTSWMTVEAMENAHEPKQLQWIDGASHVDLYDKDEFVTPAVAALAGFYQRNLK